MYVCNCNGIRAREVLKALQAGAQKPVDVFRQSECLVQCGRCLPEIRAHLQQHREAMRLAAE
jgi:bacterioferritin-associated ferredoxin